MPGRRWHGLRVMAVDGSALRLLETDKLFKAFGGQHTAAAKGAQQIPMARASERYDVGTGLTWNALVEPYWVDERTLAAKHIAHTPTDAIIVHDRGYPSFYFIAQHQHDKRHFCMRVPRKSAPETDELFKDGAPASVIFELKANRHAIKRCKEHPLTARTITVRAVRCDISSGPEVLIASLLDGDLYPAADFKELYAMRWNVEGDFRTLKSRLQMENWTGKSVESVHQDVHARILTKNLVTVLQYLAQARVDAKRAARIAQNQNVTKHRQKVNLTNALHRCKFALLKCLLNPVLAGLDELVGQLSKSINAERPGRTAPRLHPHGKSKGYATAYKQTR